MQYNTYQIDNNKALSYMDRVIQFIGISGDIKSVETKENEVFCWLDQYSGIDWICKTTENDLVSIAVRIQFDCCYYSFTMIYERHTGTKTEYQKRKEAIETGASMYPIMTLQSYIKDEKVNCAALIKTKDLYEFMENYPDLVQQRKSDNLFKVVWWKDLIDKHYPIVLKGCKILEERNKQNKGDKI